MDIPSGIMTRQGLDASGLLWGYFPPWGAADGSWRPVERDEEPGIYNLDVRKKMEENKELKDFLLSEKGGCR